MTELTGGMATDLARPAVVMFAAIELALPAGTFRLLDGAASLVFGGNAFTGRDATYGVLGALSDYMDGVDDVAPSLTATLLQTSNTGLANICAPAAQGSAFKLWIGDVTPATGAVIADPMLCFVGELDVAVQKIDRGVRSLELTLVSIFDRFFDQDEGARLNNGFHQSIWPGETGLEFVSQVQRQLPWGSDAPRPSLVTNVPQGGVGGVDVANGVLDRIFG